MRPFFRFIAAADTALLALTLAVLLVGDAPQPLWNVPGSPPAPEVTLTRPEGGSLRLGELRGRVVVVNFWASWCFPCTLEMPSLVRFGERIRGEPITILAVNAGEPPDIAAKYWGQLDPRPSFGFVRDPARTAEIAFDVAVLPTTLVIDTKGRIVYRARGERSFDDRAMGRMIRALAKE